MLVGIVNNALDTFVRRNSNRQVDAESLDRPASSQIRLLRKLRQAVNKHLVLPFTVGTYHQRPLYGFTAPTRLVGLVVFSYWLLSLVLCAVNIDAYDGNM